MDYKSNIQHPLWDIWGGGGYQVIKPGGGGWMYYLCSEYSGSGRSLKMVRHSHPQLLFLTLLSSATEPSWRLLHLSGTVCRRQYAHRRRCQFSAVDWRPNFLPGLTAALTSDRLTALTTTWPTVTVTVTCPCSPRTYAKLKHIRSSSSSSSFPLLPCSSFLCLPLPLEVGPLNPAERSGGSL